MHACFVGGVVDEAEPHESARRPRQMCAPATPATPPTPGAPATTVGPTTTAAPATSEGGLTPAEKAWIGTQIEEERRRDAEDGGLLDQIFAGAGLAETEFDCMLRDLLDRYGLDDLSVLWDADRPPNPYSDFAQRTEDYTRSFVEAVDACADIRKLMRGGLTGGATAVGDCVLGELSDELVVDLTVLTVEYAQVPGSDGSELTQLTQQQLVPHPRKCAEELLSPEEFSEFSEFLDSYSPVAP